MNGENITCSNISDKRTGASVEMVVWIFVRYSEQGGAPFMLQAVRISEPEDYLVCNDMDTFSRHIAVTINCITGFYPALGKYAEPYDKSELDTVFCKQCHTLPYRKIFFFVTFGMYCTS